MAKNTYYDNEPEMFIPLDIDSTDVEKRSYWMSDKAVGILMLLVVIPVIVGMLLFDGFNKAAMPIVQQIIILVVLLGIYLLGVVQIVLRKFVFKENQQIGIVNNIEKNRRSDTSYFYSLERVGKGSQKGVLHYIRSMAGLKRGVLVGYDNGSKINVPEGHYSRYRETLQSFYRQLHDAGFSVMYFELRVSPKLSEHLKYHRELLAQLPKEESGRKAMHSMQLTAQVAQELDREKQYKEFYLITSNESRAITRMGEVVEQIVDRSLNTNGYFVNAHILEEKEIDELLSDYYLLNDLNIKTMKRKTNSTPFEDLVTIVSRYSQGHVEITQEDFEQRVRDIELLDGLDADMKTYEDAEQEKQSIQDSIYVQATEDLLREFNKGKVSKEFYELAKDDLDTQYNVGELKTQTFKSRLQSWTSTLKEASNKERQEARKQEQEERQRLADEKRKAREDARRIQELEQGTQETKKEEVIVLDVEGNKDPLEKEIETVVNIFGGD